MNKIKSTADLTEFLWNYRYKKIASNYKSNAFFYFETEQNLSILKRCIKKWHEAKLISYDIFLNLQFRIENGTPFHQFTLLQETGSLLRYEERMKIENMNILINQLIKNGSVSSQNGNRIIEDLKDGKLKTSLDFLTYCNNAYLLNLSDFSNEPQDYFDLIHKSFKTVVTNLEFTDFKLEILDNQEARDSDANAVVSFIYNNKKYVQKSFYDSKSSTEEEYYLGKLDTSQFYEIFNKVLQDKNSKHRVYHLTLADNFENIRNKKAVSGYLLLKESEANDLRSNGGYFELSYENH